MGDFAITEELKEAFLSQNIEYFPIREATPEEFYEAIGRAKITNEHGAFVTQHTVNDYKEMSHLFITLDGTAGIAITPDNNIVSVFNGGEKRGVLKTLLPVAIENGGRKLDNYSSEKLSSLYELYGFNPISKVQFNELFAPDDWNYDRDGTPDIVFWIHNGDSAADVVINFGRYLVPWDSVQEFSTYDEAEKYRDQILEEIDLMEK
ncbi:MAG: hypothetical protein HFF79_06170 [Oscillospiraceae bacterium]|nr:hypothetical protein [Oscillospiraceae bacterium]MCI8878545.1 hypothetical protein [Oscillospiraceae bacterium]